MSPKEVNFLYIESDQEQESDEEQIEQVIFWGKDRQVGVVLPKDILESPLPHSGLIWTILCNYRGSNVSDGIGRHKCYIIWFYKDMFSHFCTNLLWMSV